MPNETDAWRNASRSFTRKSTQSSPSMLTSVLLKCPACLAVLLRARYWRGQVAVGARSTGLFRQNSKLKESWPMSKFQPGNQWSRNGNGAGRPLG